MSELTQAEKNVFGHDAVKDDLGNIVEKGKGALKNFVAGVEAAFDVGPLIEQRDALIDEVAKQAAQIADLQAQLASKQADNDKLNAELADALAHQAPLPAPVPPVAGAPAIPATPAA